LITANRALLYYGAAVCTGIAGILHLMLVPNSINSNINYAIFFLVAGIAQLFWVLPMIKRWGKIWYAVGIVGTTVLVGLTGYVIGTILENPQLAPPGISEMAIAIEAFQIAYVVITGIIIAKERKLGMIKERS
jgi:hypothetical protein